MKLRQVQFAVAIAEAGSFARAAESCNVTQPSLSSGLSALEDLLGERLFRRTTRSVELTPFGRHMMPALKELLSAEAEVQSTAAMWHMPARQMLRLGFSPLVDMLLLHRVLEPFRRQSPDTEIFFKQCLIDDMSERLAEGSVDFCIALTGSLKGRLQTHPFYSDPLFYLPMDGANDVPDGSQTIADMPDVPVIMTGGGCGLNGALDRLFADEGKQLTAYPGQAISYPVIAEWAGLGIGAGILPSAHVAVETAARPLIRADGQQAEFRFEWHWPNDGAGGAHITAFRDHVRHRVGALVAGMAA